MTEAKVWISHFDPDWVVPLDYMVFIFIPRKWWSISAWKLAIDLKKNFVINGFIKETK